MKITEIRVKLMENSEDRLRAFCSVTFDNSFVVRDLKIIDGNSGPFVAMPSRKLTGNCPECRFKNHLRARFCNQCGKRQPNHHVAFDHQGRARLYADVAHPINADCRESIQDHVIREFQAELERAKSPDYVSRYDDTYEMTASSQAEVETKVEQIKKPAPAAAVPAVTEDKVNRIDDPQSKIPTPHKPDSESASEDAATQLPVQDDSQSDPANREDFGEGIFD